MEVPTNERETIFLFDSLSDRTGWYLIYNDSPFPDAIIGNNQGHTLWVEFEYLARNFQKHGHDPSGCDLIICWINNWTDCPLPVWELKDTVYRIGLLEQEEPESSWLSHYLIVQLRINRAKEPDIVHWIEGRENRTQALLGLVRVHLGLMPADPEAQPPLPSTLDVCAIRSILDEYTPQLRKVLAALLDQKLRGLVVGGGATSEEATDPTLDAKIDQMF